MSNIERFSIRTQDAPRFLVEVLFLFSYRNTSIQQLSFRLVRLVRYTLVFSPFSHNPPRMPLRTAYPLLPMILLGVLTLCVLFALVATCRSSDAISDTPEEHYDTNSCVDATIQHGAKCTTHHGKHIIRKMNRPGSRLQFRYIPLKECIERRLINNNRNRKTRGMSKTNRDQLNKMHTHINNSKINTCNQKQILSVSTKSNKQALAGLTNKPQYLHKGSFSPKNSAAVHTDGVLLDTIRKEVRQNRMKIRQLDKAVGV